LGPPLATLAAVFIPPADRTIGEEEWRPFVDSQRFGHLVAAGAEEYPVVAPTQFVLDGQRVLCHFAAPNPVFEALAADPRALMSVAGDWAFIPSSWKAIGEEDPLLGIPTTYYAAVQLRGRAEVLRQPDAVADVLRVQLEALQPGVPVADPLEVHTSRLKAIHAVVLTVEDVRAKFKFGGNVDAAHRRAVIARLADRAGPGDRAAASHTDRRLSLSRS
jgi:transcriptional regulator